MVPRLHKWDIHADEGTWPSLAQRRSGRATGITRAPGPGCERQLLSGRLNAAKSPSAGCYGPGLPSPVTDALGSPLVYLHPGASRCRYLMTGCDSPVRCSAQFESF